MYDQSRNQVYYWRKIVLWASKCYFFLFISCVLCKVNLSDIREHKKLMVSPPRYSKTENIVTNCNPSKI